MAIPRSINILNPFVILSWFLISPVWATVPSSDEQSIVIEEGQVFEVCIPIEKGQTLEFEFDASQEIEFNLHYHRDNLIYFPVPKHKTNASSGEVVSVITKDYCLMWRNHKSDETAVNFRYQVK